MDFAICRIDAVEWLTDERWIVFSFYGGFAQYLEHCYFTPGTPKNAEFEVMVAPVAVNGIFGIAPFYSSCTDAEKEFITVLAANPHLLSLKWFGC